MIDPSMKRPPAPVMMSSIISAVCGEVALQSAIAALQRVYSPQGFNIGMNIGRVAGAGIADHLHWHIVPRWEGDTNFMPLLADTKVMPQHIEDAYDKLLPQFEAREL